MYADDSTLTASHRNIEEFTLQFNNELDCIQDWCDINRMVINTAKTHSMLVTTAKKRSNLQNQVLNLDIKDKSLHSISHEKVLGVAID